MAEETQVADVVAEPVATEAPSEGFDWRTHIPEELKGNTAFDNHKDLGSLLKSHANVQRDQQYIVFFLHF